MSAYTNILSFDGGGTRGITSLIILNAIMLEINSLLSDPDTVLQPQDVFDAVSGTSTGGLIALMIGRFGFTVKDCMRQYQEMAREIFGKPNRLGIWSRGFLQDRYNSKPLEDCVRKLVTSPEVGEDAEAFLSAGPPKAKHIDCTLVTCRLNNSGDPESEAVLLCSHEHIPDLAVRIWEAARATTAAPTYFEACIFGNPPRAYIDGGFGHNNPTFDTLSHYSDMLKARSNSPRNVTPPIRIISIGTGQKTRDKELVSGPLNASGYPATATFSSRIKSLLKLNKGAMRLISAVDNQEALYKIFRPEDLQRHRFSGAPGVGNIALDTIEETKVELMRKSTEDWLQEEEIKKQIKAVAQELLDSWKARRSAAAPQAAPSRGSQALPQPHVSNLTPVNLQQSEVGTLSTSSRTSLSIPAIQRQTVSRQDINANGFLTPTIPALTDGETQADSSEPHLTPHDSRAPSPVERVNVLSEATMAASTSRIGEQFSNTPELNVFISSPASVSGMFVLRGRKTM